MVLGRSYRGRPTRSRWLYYRLFFIAFVASCYLWYCTSNQGISRVAQNEQRSTSKRSSSSHVEKGQKMALVLVPANVELPTGSIALSAEVAARPLNTIVQGGTGPGEEPPEPYQKKYIEHWDSSMMQNTAQQAEQPAMGKKYIEHWDSSMMQISAPKDQPERIMMAKRGPKEWELDLQPEPVMGRKFIDTEVKWEPQAKDQLIIVTTMAVMALLVGAISARRLRNRRGKGYGDWLSACIENNVEDELAYDAATTFSGAYSAVGGVYDTFSQVSGNGWRNELERFDV